MVSTALTIVALRGTKRAQKNLSNTPSLKNKLSSSSQTSSNMPLPSRKDTLAQKIKDYYFSSQVQLQRKRSQVLTLVITNFLSILVETAFILFLTVFGTPLLNPTENSQICEAKFDWPLIWIVVIQFIQALSSFTPIILVFYFIYWTHRHHARRYERLGSDILLCEEDLHSPLIRRVSYVSPPRQKQQDWIEFHENLKIVQSKKPVKFKKTYLKKRFTVEEEEEERVNSTSKLPVSWVEPLLTKQCASD